MTEKPNTKNIQKYNTFHEALLSTTNIHEEIIRKYNIFKEYYDEYDDYSYCLVVYQDKIVFVIEFIQITWIVVPYPSLYYDELKAIINYMEWTDYEIEVSTTENNKPYIELTENTLLDEVISALNKTN